MRLYDYYYDTTIPLGAFLYYKSSSKKSAFL